MMSCLWSFKFFLELLSVARIMDFSVVVRQALSGRVSRRAASETGAGLNWDYFEVVVPVVKRASLAADAVPPESIPNMFPQSIHLLDL
jgi:hypothetical protein